MKSTDLPIHTSHLKCSIQTLWAVAALIVSLAGFASANVAEDWTLIALPDTQMYSQSHPQIFRAQAQWIADHARDVNIKMVLHEGDVVNKGANDTAQWPNAKVALDIIDQAGVPMFIAMGNHDYDNMAKTRAATFFNRYFGVSRYEGRTWFGGLFEAGKSENVYGLINAGGRDYLVFALEFSPRQAVVDWANDIIAKHPARDVIIVTHNFLYSDGTHHDRLVQGTTYGISNDAKNGRQLWEELVSKNNNVVLVLNGHVGGDGVAQRTDFSANGNMVHQLETNFQFNAMGGEGYFRVMRFRPAAGVIEVKTYSPYLDKYRTEPDNQFVLPYNPSDRTAPSVSIKGKVMDLDSQQGVNYALVTLQQDGKSLNADRSNTDGSFAFRVPPGNYDLQVTAANYLPTLIAVDSATSGIEHNLAVSLKPTQAAGQVWAGMGGSKLSGLAEGTNTDIVMQNNKLTMVIAASFRDPQLLDATIGKPIDMAASGVTDGIDWMNFYLSLQQPVWDNSGATATVLNKSVRIAHVTGEEAVVEADGIYTEVPEITLKTIYTLRPDEEWVYALTTISNQGDKDITLWAGDVMDNDDGKQVVYVPGSGDLGPGTKGRKVYQPNAPWVGHYGDAPQGYAYIYNIGYDDFIDFGANITIMTQKQITVPAHGKYEIGRYIVVASSAGRQHKMDAITEIYEKIQDKD